MSIVGGGLAYAAASIETDVTLNKQIKRIYN